MFDSFRCVVPLNKHPHPFSHNDSAMMLGSCFSQNISTKLSTFLFKINCNPTGILYNPFSISSAIERIISGKPYEEKDLFFHNELWHSFDHHSRFSHHTVEAALDEINESLYTAHIQFNKITHLILTPGTSFTFRNNKSGKIVANCHRLPQYLFTRYCETPASIVINWTNLLETIRAKFQHIHIILTISPVRHYPSAPVDNQVSKANIISAFDTLSKKYPDIYYFPSYEIMMDELRDYRFYERDMVHPNSTAVDYIWKRFREACITERSNQFIDEYTTIQSSLEHRLSDKSSPKVLAEFVNNSLQKIDKLIQKFPEIDLSKPHTYFEHLGHNGNPCLP